MPDTGFIDSLLCDNIGEIASELGLDKGLIVTIMLSDAQHTNGYHMMIKCR